VNVSRELINEINNIAKMYSEIEKIVLFGSRAKGDNNEKSDIDLAIYTKNNKFDSWLKFYESIDQMDTLIKIDLVHVNENIDKQLLNNIINEGVVIMSNETKIINFLRATNRLSEALLECGENPTPLNRDGAIKRYEFSTEFAWKACKEYLDDKGFAEVNGPKPVMREAFSFGLVSESNAWIDILNDRDLISHIYKEETAIEIFNRIKDIHIKYFKELCEKLNEH